MLFGFTAVNVPATVSAASKIRLGLLWASEPELFNTVRLLNADVPESVPPNVCRADDVAYTSPELWVNVPLFVKFPPSVSREGATTVPAVIVMLVVEALFEKVQPPPEPLNVTFPRAEDPVSVPAIVLPVVVALKIVEPVFVYVPLFERFPARVRVCDEDIV